MIQNFFSLSTWFMFFLFVEHLGERALAITNIIRNVSGIPFMVAMAFATTCGSLVSNLIGAGEIKSVPGTIRQHVRIGYVFVLPLVLFFALFPDLVLSIYTDIPDLKEASIPSLWVLCSAYLILVPANVYFQAVSGTGNTRTALGLELCVLAVYLAYITYVILYLRVDVAFCWTTEHLYGICILTLSYIYIKKGNWQKSRFDLIFAYLRNSNNQLLKTYETSKPIYYVGNNDVSILWRNQGCRQNGPGADRKIRYQNRGKRMTPEALWAMGRIGGLSVSPDGKQIAYTVAYYSVPENKSNREVFVMNADGTDNRQITHTPFQENEVTWATDGSKLLFLSNDNGSSQLYEMNPDGSGRKQISNYDGNIEGYSISPDGKKILFIAQVKTVKSTADKYPDLDKATGIIITDLMYKHWDEWVTTAPTPLSPISMASR